MWRSVQFACAALLFIVGLGAASAADEKKPAPQSLQDLDRQLGETFRDLNIPGASVAIIENNTIVLAKGYGYADVAAKKPVTPETIFRAGSISKNFVGISVMMLVEEGKLDLNAKLADLAPEIKFENRWEATDPVRLAHLMEHTTGFDDIRFSQYLFDGKDTPLARAIELYGPYESRWKPAMYPSYSNAPPVIAGYIVEKASGMSWADFTRTRIFEPLGMTSAHWDKSPLFADRLSKSYRADGVTEEPYFDIPGKPAGSLNVTPTDLAKLAIMLNNRGTISGMTLLKPESVDRMETPHTTLASRLGLKYGYGLGNAVVSREKSIYHGHNGGIDGFLSLYVYEPSQRAGFVIMVNAANGESFKAMDPVVAYLERNLTKPQIAAVAPPAGELDRLVGVYQSISPRQQMLAILEALFDWTVVTEKDGKLMIDEKEQVRVGDNLYQRVDRSVPGTVFASSEDGTLLLTANGASRMVPIPEFVGKAAFALVYGLSLFLGAILLLVWTFAGLAGRLRDRGGALVRVVPALSLFVPLALLGVFIAAVSEPSMGAVVTVGTPSAMAQVIYGLSIAVPVVGALSLLVALFARGETPALIRLFALTNSALVLAAAAFLWQYGWIGIKTWL